MKKRFKAYSIVFLAAFLLSILLTLLNLYGSGIFVSISGRLNQGTVSLFIEGVDDQAPSLSIVYPTDGETYSSHRTELNYTVSDSFGVESCWYTLDFGETNFSVSCGINVTGITSNEGSNIWTVYANDSSNNKNSSSISFTISSSTSPPAGSSGGGGGGGGYSFIIQPDFEVNPEELNIFTLAGENGEKEIFITNLKNNSLVIDVEVTGIEGFVSLSTTSVYLASGESKSLLLFTNFNEPGVYAGKIIFKSANTQKETLVLANVRGGEALFDVSLVIPTSYKNIFSGGSLKTFISLLQLGPAAEVDVVANYFIKDFDGKTLVEESETFRVYQKKDVVKEFSNLDLPAGDYVVAIEIIYPGGFAVSSAHFNVIERVSLEVISVFLATVAVVSLIVWSILRYQRLRRIIKRRK